MNTIHYYGSYEHGKIHVKELSQWAYDGRCQYEKDRNTFNSVPIYESIQALIKAMDGYSKPIVLPDGKEVIPAEQNYHIDYSVLIPVVLPIKEYVYDHETGKCYEL